MDLFSSISTDTISADFLQGKTPDIPLPLGDSLRDQMPVAAVPVAPQRPPSPRKTLDSSLTDEWTAGFARDLQSQHARIREFLQSRSDRWRQIVTRFTRQIEKLEAEVRALTAANEVLHMQAACAVEAGPPALDAEASDRYFAAMEEIRELKARNAELQRQSRTASAVPARASGPVVPAIYGEDWESQKRRLLAELESDDGQDEEAVQRQTSIQEIIERTDKIIAEKDLEIEELKHMLNSQANSLGSLAVGAAALDQVFDQDEIIREERQRLQQAHEELSAKLRAAEIEHAMERARLARREAEVEERLRGGEANRGGGEVDAEALAPTGRPVRGRWRTQMGLDDDPSDAERARR